MLITTNLDPLSPNDAAGNSPHRLREGNLDIRFESMENLITYRSMHVERAGVDLVHSLVNPTDKLGTD